MHHSRILAIDFNLCLRDRDLITSYAHRFLTGAVLKTTSAFF